MIPDIEQETSDFDYFFTNGKYVGFVASIGGKLPLSVARSRENLAVLWEYFDGLPYRCGVVVIPELNDIVKLQMDDWQLVSFTGMASRGLFAFDKTTMNAFYDPHYHLIASPVDPLKLAELPAEIVTILSATKYNGVMGDSLNSQELS